MWERGILSLTVIMQLVFECSYHTNVDRLHFQSCVPGVSQYPVKSFSFHLLFLMSALNPVAPCAAHLLCFLVSCTFVLEADVRIGCKVMDNMENKTVLLWYWSHVMSCCDWFLPTCNHKWEVEHFVCLISTKKDEEKDLYKSIVWPFHSQDLRCHDGRVIPYQCLNLYFHLRQFLFCEPYHFIYLGD